MKKFLLLLLLSASTLYALEEGDYLVGVFYIPLGPRSREELEEPPVEEDIYRKILEEARYVFSGMIYGFEFVYSPSDNRRQIQEFYDVKLMGEIPWGDPRLKVRHSRRVDQDFYITIEYFLSEDQKSRRKAWEVVNLPNVYGIGSGNYFLGTDSRIEAIKNAIKEGIRNYLRPREYNKPREVCGEAQFRDVPSYYVDAGEIHAKAKMKMNILEVVPYKSF